MAAHQKLQNQLIGLWLYSTRKISRRRKDAAPRIYLAYSIGPEMLAILARELDALTDEAALREAIPLFHNGLKRIEVWCGPRKVGDIPSRSDELSGGEAVRDPA
jgi:hypothetical protein